MNSAERRSYMRLLVRARAGDEDACNRLTAGLAKHFFYMIRGYNSADPAFDNDDLELHFQMGIWQAIERVDGRGDPLYYLAWRGQCAVRSLLTAIKQRRYGTPAYVDKFGEQVSVGTLPEGFDLPDYREEIDPVAATIRHEDQQEAHQRVVDLLGQAALTERQRQVVGWMITDPDINEDGANVRLAQQLGVSPQATSQLRKKVVEKLGGGGQQSVLQFQCLRCGRGFKTRGALTQHERGQSGHRPCPGAVVGGD